MSNTPAEQYNDKKDDTPLSTTESERSTSRNDRENTNSTVNVRQSPLASLPSTFNDNHQAVSINEVTDGTDEPAVSYIQYL